MPNLGDADNDRHAQGESDSKVLFRHTYQPCVASYNENNTGRRAGGKPIKRCFEIPLMSC
jgi:hypothetical protein